MSNYQKTTAQVQAWKHCKGFIIDTPYLGQKSVNFIEENIASTETGITKADAGICYAAYLDNSPIPMVDMETLEPTEIMVPFSYIYKLLVSAYLKAARARDLNSGDLIFKPVEEIIEEQKQL